MLSRPLMVLLVLAVQAAAQCETQTLLANDGMPGDSFGNAVSLWGDTVLVGAVFDNGIGPDSGSAYIFERQGGTWVQTAKLVAHDETDFDRFGAAAGLWDDRAIVSARYNDDAGYGSGSAYVFERQGGDWTQTAYLVASTEQNDALFGSSVDIRDELAAVGAPLENSPVGGTSGAVHLFERQAGTWTHTTRLTASLQGPDDRFGTAVAIGDGRLVVGGRHDSSAAPQAGAAWIFDDTGPGWVEQAKLVAGDPETAALFGEFVAVQDDIVVVSALLEDAIGPDSGAVYVYERQDGSWVQVDKLVNPDSSGLTYFGSMALAGDTMLVGAWGDGSSGPLSGAVHVFRRSGSQWLAADKITASDAQAGERFGSAVSMWGTRALIGAVAGSNGGGVSTGKAYTFTNVGTLAPYGAGSPGLGGLVPSLAGDGCTAPGGDVTLAIADGRPGAQATLLFGLDAASFPVVGCTLLMFPLLPLQVPLTLDGTGTFDLAGQVPASAVPSLTVRMQVFVVDAAAPQGYSATNGLALTIDD